MQTTVTARHCEISAELTERARGVMERVGQYSPHALDASVVFDRIADGAQAEIRLHVRGGQVLVATAAESDHRTALDRAEDKIRRQLEKTVTQAKRGRRPAANP
ncbi:MAG: HPF/RaiA family ribosome-associated protein [Gemmatimonadales bacterium]